jgi:hypothetical protein
MIYLDRSDRVEGFGLRTIARVIDGDNNFASIISDSFKIGSKYFLE